MDVHSTNYTLCAMEPVFGADDRIYATIQVSPDYKNILLFIEKVKQKLDPNDTYDIECGYEAEFLSNPIIPMDNNDAERSIRSFCVGKHNWKLCDTKNGAKSSGILYSIAETAKVNNLKPAEYMQYLLEQILLHDEDAPSTYLPLLMPWSEDLPDSCRNTLKS